MKNTVASVRDRLLNLSRERGIPFQRLLTLYMQEGLLRRIASTKLGDEVVLKGGLVLYQREGLIARPTKDIDLLGTESVDGMEMVLEMLQEASQLSAPDALKIHQETITVDPIRARVDRGGVRAHVLASLGTAQTRLQVDVGFGDAVYGGAESTSFRTLLNENPFDISVYPAAVIVAEKLEATISLGNINTRTKDLFDLYRLIVQTGRSIDEAVSAGVETFRTRRTVLVADPVALAESRWRSNEFRLRWNAFLNRIRMESPSQDELLTTLLPALQLIYRAIRQELHGANAESQR